MFLYIIRTIITMGIRMNTHIKMIFVILSMLGLSGCATTTIRDYDGENISQEEKQQLMDEGGIQYTESIIELISDNGITIIATKTTPTLTVYHDYEVVQDNWDITALNTTTDSECVTLLWKLMDFKFVSEYPSEFLVRHSSSLHIGTMIQQVWEIQGVKFTPDSSGYVAGMLVREPIPNAAIGDECTFIELERDIVER